jgi:phospholipid/cholesterol/gamma-HCH transport system substrate-binding protein
VVSDGLLGGAYVGIMVGGSFDFVPEGGQIEFTRGSVDLLTVLSEVAQSAAGGGGSGGGGGDKSGEASQ